MHRHVVIRRDVSVQPQPRPLRLADGTTESPAHAAHYLPSAPEPVPRHYLDYSRSLTPEGGVLITYRDIDTRWRWHAWRAFAFSLATGFDTWLAFYQSPVGSFVLNILCWLVAAALNLFIVLAGIKTHRRIEIRPDCLILDGREVFWRQHLEGGWPELRQQDQATFIFGGIYGTRFVEFGTLRRFDDNDRMPETFAAHVQQAVEQLWTA